MGNPVSKSDIRNLDNYDNCDKNPSHKSKKGKPLPMCALPGLQVEYPFEPTGWALNQARDSTDVPSGLAIVQWGADLDLRLGVR